MVHTIVHMKCIISNIIINLVVLVAMEMALIILIITVLSALIIIITKIHTTHLITTTATINQQQLLLPTLTMITRLQLLIVIHQCRQSWWKILLKEMSLLGWLLRLKQHDDIETWYSSIFLLSACPTFSFIDCTVDLLLFHS
jgi:ABC-type bacteriocin/lantibiotic exporter with double-glycine peptidase domain